MDRYLHVALPLVLGAALFGPAPAAASGYLPMPELHESLPSFRACLARLSAAYAEDRKAEKPRKIAADGSVSAADLETRTKGVERTGRSKARYHGRMWYTHGGIAAHDAAQRELSHSWEEHELTCAGRQLTIRSANGYTLSTFEPIEGLAPKEPAATAPKP